LTTYVYDEAVAVCHNVAHLLPRDSERHTWLSSELEVSPEPTVRAERRDYFGNRLTFFAIQEPHRELQVLAKSEVDVEPAGELGGVDVAWDEARERVRRDVGHGQGLDVYQYTFQSPFVHVNGEVADYARESFAPGRGLLEGAEELTARIFRDFKYDPKCTTVTTTLPEVMKARAGVCQDFAHLAVGCFRSVGLAARYVSGYLMTVPPPGKPRLTGADASHAWVSVYIPGIGWVDFDPTNNLRPSEQHITLAWGRDFGDVSPLRGVLLGTGRHVIRVSVDVLPLMVG
jgi:transglutaminase-like putative cysteine protease